MNFCILYLNVVKVNISNRLAHADWSETSDCKYLLQAMLDLVEDKCFSKPTGKRLTFHTSRYTNLKVT